MGKINGKGEHLKTWNCEVALDTYTLQVKAYTAKEARIKMRKAIKIISMSKAANFKQSTVKTEF